MKRTGLVSSATTRIKNHVAWEARRVRVDAEDRGLLQPEVGARVRGQVRQLLRELRARLLLGTAVVLTERHGNRSRESLCTTLPFELVKARRFDSEFKSFVILKAPLGLSLRVAAIKIIVHFFGAGPLADPE